MHLKLPLLAMQSGLNLNKITQHVDHTETALPSISANFSAQIILSENYEWEEYQMTEREGIDININI